MRYLTKLLILSCLLTSPPLHAAGYRFETIDVPGAIATRPHGVNARGEIVGLYADANDVSHNFLLRHGVFKTIEFPGASEMLAARGINARGDIVGNFIDSNDVTRGYLLSNGKFRQIDYPESTCTVLNSINNAGEIVGFYCDENDVAHAFMRNRDGKFLVIEVPWAFIHVRSLQDNGRVLVGSAEYADGSFRGYIRTKPGEFEIIEFPGLPVPCSIVRHINQRGDMVGNFASVNTIARCNPDTAKQRGFLLRDGQFKVIHYPGAADTDPFAINDDGTIVGSFTDTDGNLHGFRAIPRD